MYSHPPFRHHYVVSDKASVLAQTHGFAVHIERQVWKLSSQGGIGEEVADAAFDIDPGVDARSACSCADRIEAILDTGQMQSQLFEH